MEVIYKYILSLVKFTAFTKYRTVVLEQLMFFNYIH